MAYRPPDDDNPFEMRGKKPSEEKEGGYQDTSIDDADRDFGMRERSKKEEKGGNSEVRNLRKVFHLTHMIFLRHYHQG